nr:SBBP repeat-containing protein [Bacteroidota bacterium]
QQPGFQWAKSMGGSIGDETPSAITTDASGNVYTIGVFTSLSDFDPGPSTYTLNATAPSDIFISKLDAAGNFVWAKAIGGPSGDVPYSIAADANGNVYSTGWFDGTTDFDPGAANYNLTAALRDQFILKLDAGGNFVWAKQIGASTASMNPVAIALDAAGDVYTTGNFEGTADFDPGVGTYTMVSTGASDLFILKIDAAGNFVWANRYGSVGNDYVKGMALDAFGTVYTIGTFDAAIDFGPSLNSTTLTPVSGADMFFSVVDGSGNFIFAKQLGDPGSFAIPYSIDIDAQNNIYATGIFGGGLDFDPSANTANLNSIGNVDGFILKLDAAGNYVWAKNIGGANASCLATCIKTDAIHNVYITGYFDMPIDFDPGLASNVLNVSGSLDAYLLKLDPTGNFTWVKKFGGNGLDIGTAIALDPASNIHLTGRFEQSADFDPTAGTTTLTSAGWTDVFIVKLNQSLTGLKEQTTANALSVFPNPAKENITIELDQAAFDKLTGNVTIEIYNALGQKLSQETLNDKRSGINTAFLTKGLYVVRIINNESVIATQKIIKE